MEYHRQLSQGERTYIKMWQRESGKWLKLHLFERAVEVLRPKGNGIHVDIGSGNGAMLATLNDQYPDLKLVGVERYQSLLDLAQRNFRKVGISCTVLNDLSLERPNGHRLAAGVTLIRDNIQSLQLLKMILGEEKVSSASFMFPGITKISAVQPVEQRKELELLNLMAELRQKVCQCLSEIVMPGGKMVLAEKTTLDSLGDDITGKIVSLMGGYDRYWDEDEGDKLYGLHEEITGVKRIDTIRGKIPEHDEELTFVIKSFRRNIQQYGDEGPKNGDEEPKLTDRQKRNSDEWKRFMDELYRVKVTEE